MSRGPSISRGVEFLSSPAKLKTRSPTRRTDSKTQRQTRLSSNIGGSNGPMHWSAFQRARSLLLLISIYSTPRHSTGIAAPTCRSRAHTSRALAVGTYSSSRAMISNAAPARSNAASIHAEPAATSFGGPLMVSMSCMVAHRQNCRNG